MSFTEPESELMRKRGQALVGTQDSRFSFPTTFAVKEMRIPRHGWILPIAGSSNISGPFLIKL